MQNCLSVEPGYRGFDAVAIAASLGGPAALGVILENLPTDFPASVLVAQHVSRVSAPLIVHQLNHRSTLPVALAEHGETVQPGRVYLAPPDVHLLVGLDRTLSLARTPKVKFCRPAAEPLLTSVAATFRKRALGLILTGCNTDGAFGAQAITWMGGRVLVQEPGTARAPAMPRAAISTGFVDYVLPLEKIAAALVALVMAPGVADYLRVQPTAA